MTKMNSPESLASCQTADLQYLYTLVRIISNNSALKIFEILAHLRRQFTYKLISKMVQEKKRTERMVKLKSKLPVVLNIIGEPAHCNAKIYKFNVINPRTYFCETRGKTCVCLLIKSPKIWSMCANKVDFI